MDIEELKARVKEKAKKFLPDFEIGEETEDYVEYKKGKMRHQIFFSKLLDELNQSYPSEWEKLIEKRFKMMDWEEQKKKKMGLVPRMYSKETMPPKEKLEKAGIIVLGESEDEIAILSVETEDGYFGMPVSEMKKKFGFTDEEIEMAKEKAKKKAEEFL